jgi:hypothetical protein
MLRWSTAVFVFALVFGVSGSAFADIDPEPPDLPSDESDDGSSKGGCSVESAKLELAALAALVLLISGARLRQRRAEAV